MYYYNINGATMVSLTPLEGFGPEIEPTQSWRLFAAVPGDPVLGRGSFKVNQPGQLLAGHGLETLDKSRLGEYMGSVGEDKMQEVDAALSVSVGLRNT